MKKSVLISIIIFCVLLADQALKFWVKTNMYYGERIKILGLEWAQLHFIENPGMAFGIEFGGDNGKLILSIFRIVVICILIYILAKMVKSKEPFGLVICFGLIIAGAIGNILDSAFYGLIFSASLTHGRNIAEFMPADGGYTTFLHGKVVDMFYFPLIDTRWPDWVPIVGGEALRFFRPVFNLADTSISVGVASILIFHRKYFKAEAKDVGNKKEVGNKNTVLGRDEEE